MRPENKEHLKESTSYLRKTKDAIFDDFSMWKLSEVQEIWDEAIENGWLKKIDKDRLKKIDGDFWIWHEEYEAEKERLKVNTLPI